MPAVRPTAFLLLLALGSGSALAAPDVFIAYPPPDHRVGYDHVILEGSVTPGASLTVNGKRVAVGSDGLFMEWWPLQTGVNVLKLVASQGGQSGSASIRVTRTVAKVMPATPTAIDRTSVTPRENIEFWDAARDSVAERTISVSFKGSAGGKATFHVANGPLQPMREGPAGTYTGAFTLLENASVLNAAITVHLTGRNGRTVSAAAPGRLSSTQGALKTGVQKPGTIQGLGINDALNSVTTLDGQPVLYPRHGMTFTLVGRQGRDLRARLAPGFSVLVSASQLALSAGAPPLARSGPIRIEGAVQAAAPVPTPPTPTPPTPSPVAAAPVSAPPVNPAAAPTNVPAIPATPAATVIPASAPGTGAEPSADPASMTPPEASPAPVPAPVSPAPAPAPLSTPVPPPVPTPAPTQDARIRIPLGGQRVPFQVQQAMNGQVQVTLYGLIVPPIAPTSTDPLIRSVTVLPSQGQSKVAIDLTTAQTWGFTANYEGADLVVTLRRPPPLSRVAPLLGRTLTIDPGHGGTQKGGAGSLRVPEKNIVLPIALRVADLLRAQGARVNLTRTTDVTLDLYERDLSAEQTGSDLLVSIHANALPDGRNPAGIRGPEVFFTHAQAQGVSQRILDQLRAKLPELGPGKGLMPGANLALTRPTTQISLLVEMAYLTDAGNLRALMSPDGQERFAQAIAQGIIDFYVSQAQ